MVDTLNGRVDVKRCRWFLVSVRYDYNMNWHAIFMPPPNGRRRRHFVFGWSVRQFVRPLSVNTYFAWRDINKIFITCVGTAE